MNLIKYLEGKKTYIVSLAFVVYGILAYYKVVPNPEALAPIAIGVGAMAASARSALASEVNKVISATTAPVISPDAMKAINDELAILKATVAGLISKEPTTP